jgi:hypothetical protein
MNDLRLRGIRPGQEVLEVCLLASFPKGDGKRICFFGFRMAADVKPTIHSLMPSEEDVTGS